MSPILGTLYRKYLSGSDLRGEIITVKILDIYKIYVTPPPRFDQVEKWCLKVTAPENLPDQIIMGPTHEKQLVHIFGQVDAQSIIGKSIGLVPVNLKIAGTSRVGLKFIKPAAANPKATVTPEPVQEPAPEEDDLEMYPVYTTDDDVPY